MLGYAKSINDPIKLVGQTRWKDLGNGMIIPDYDPSAPVWECYTEDGGTFMWRHDTHCFGSPAGKCNRVLKKYEHTLCRACDDNYEHECESIKRQEKKTAIMTRAIEDGALPRWFKTWTRPLLTKSQAVAMSTIESNEKSCVFIQGLGGRGKTDLGCAVLLGYLERCRTAAFADGPVIYESRRNRALYNHLTTCDCLLFDDIDKDNLTTLNVAQIHNILSARHHPRLRTIATSEIAMHGVTTLFHNLSNEPHGKSTLDRMNFPQAPCIQIELTGPNLRRTV